MDWQYVDDQANSKPRFPDCYFDAAMRETACHSSQLLNPILHAGLARSPTLAVLIRLPHSDQCHDRRNVPLTWAFRLRGTCTSVVGCVESPINSMPVIDYTVGYVVCTQNPINRCRRIGSELEYECSYSFETKVLVPKLVYGAEGS